jgi:uncharacterized membrane protein YfcA
MTAGLFLILVFLGALVGYISGLFGVGGGFLMTPLLVNLLGFKYRVAVGSEVTQMIAVGIAAARRHGAKGYVDLHLAAYMAPGVVLGTILGKQISDYLHGLGAVLINGHEAPVIRVVLNMAFGVMLAGVAIYLWWRKPAEEGEVTCAGPLCWRTGPLTVPLPASGLDRVSMVALSASGIGLGILAGLLGIGGGVLLVPLFLFGFGIPTRQAIGSCTVLILISALSSTVQYAWSGEVDLGIVLGLLVGSAIGVPLGAWHSHRTKISGLQRGFALLVLLVVGVIGYDLGKLLLPR